MNPRMLAPSIVIVDVDAGIPHADIVKAAGALTRQCLEQFALAWGVMASVRAASPGDPPRPTEWRMELRKVPTVDGALGYHDETDDGIPILYVFPELCASDGTTWTSCASHEILEALADPLLRRCIQADDGSIWDAEVCFTGDTRVSLLDGSEVAIADLVGRDEFWVYSSDSTGAVIPGRGHSARLTRKDTEIVAVLLDNGEVIRCTPDHRFMLRDGSYRRAGELCEGTSLMPLYRRRAPIAAGNPLDYEQLWNPHDGEWKFTHRVVQPQCPNGYVRHHVDFDRFNNAPTNLTVMLLADHFKLHGDHTRERNLRWAAEGVHPWQRERTVEQRQQARDQIAKYNQSPEREAAWRAWNDRAIAAGEHPWQQPQSDEHREDSRQRLTAYNKSDKHRATAAAVGGETFRKLWADPAYRERMAPMMAQRNALSNHRRWHERRNVVNPSCLHCVTPNNHKVVSVTPAGTADVYDFKVDATANFALSAGVFVHNCDRVEADTYTIDGVQVSNFNLPACFEPPKKRDGVTYDYLGKSTKPNEVRTGGYAQKFNPTRGWTQVGEMRSYRAKLAELGLSRNAKRLRRLA